MDKIKTTEGDLIVRDARFAIVAARFNDFIVDSLLKASLHCLRQHGASDADIEIVRVPGSFEMPVAVDKVAASRVAARRILNTLPANVFVVLQRPDNGTEFLSVSAY
jgi:6,7-dimethyl-8-ribityllumazine synthase